MLVLINALKSISRSKGRNMLIALIVIVIAASSCLALAIKNAASEAETTGTDLVTITGSIAVDRQKMIESLQADFNEESGPPDMSAMRENMGMYEDLTLDELLPYSQSEYVKDFYYSVSVLLNAEEELLAYGSETSSDTSS